MYGFQWPGSENRVKTFKLVFLHVALPLLTWIYIIFGACVFYNIEQPNEILVKNRNLADLRHLQRKMIGQLYDRVKIWSIRKEEETIDRLNFSESSYVHYGLTEFDELMLATYKAFQSGVSAKDIDAKTLKLDWTFFSSIFFSTTVITTIGYGNLVPSTFWGRMFCIFYALIGIPLTLVTTADVGKFMSTFIIWLYGIVSNFVGHGFARMKKICLLIGRNSKNFSSTVHLKDRESRKIETIIEEKGDEENPLEGNGVSRSLNQQKKVSFREEDELTVESRDSFGLDQGFEMMPVPQSFVIFILLGYTAVGAILFCFWEQWGFIDSFYFCLITMTTVGFGDLVPTHESYMLLAIVFIFVGLVLATMCIDTVGTHYIRRLHYFGRKIQTAQQVLAIIGGKALTLGDWIKHVKQVQNRFDLSDEQTRLIMLNPDEYANFVQEQQQIVLQFQKSARLGSFNPYDLDTIRFIDQIYDFTPRSEKCYRPSQSGSSPYSGRWLYF